MNKANELVVIIFISIGKVFTNLVYIRHFTVEYTNIEFVHMHFVS